MYITFVFIFFINLDISFFLMKNKPLFHFLNNQQYFYFLIICSQCSKIQQIIIWRKKKTIPVIIVIIVNTHEGFSQLKHKIASVCFQQSAKRKLKFVESVCKVIRTKALSDFRASFSQNQICYFLCLLILLTSRSNQLFIPKGEVKTS